MTNKYAAQAKAARRKRNWMRHCGRKRKFNTEEEARNFQQPPAEAYKCKSCGFWHRSETLNAIVNISSKAKKRKRKG